MRPTEDGGVISAENQRKRAEELRRAQERSRGTPDPARFARGEIGATSVGGGQRILELNPRFDPRMYTRTYSAKKGRIIAHQPINGAYRTVNFLFNPSTVPLSYTSVVTADQAKNPLPNVTPEILGQGSLSLSLLFDRTYEVWERGPSLAANFGVQIDVMAFYALFNMIDPGRFNISMPWEDLYPKQAFQMVWAYLYVGRNLKFYGHATSFAVEYTHFAADMTPVRAAIGLEFWVAVTNTGPLAPNPDPNASDPGTPPGLNKDDPRHVPDYNPWQ